MNKKYWVERATDLEYAIQEEAERAAERITAEYQTAIQNIADDIHDVYREFARASGINEDDAKKILTKNQNSELYKDLIELYNETEDGKLKKELMLKINAQAYGARITRLEAVQVRAYMHLKRAYGAEIKEYEKLAKKTLNQSYYSNIYNMAEGLNAGIDFSILPTKAIEKAMSANWLGSNYSQRVWNNNEMFISKVQHTIKDALITGKSRAVAAQRLEEFVNDESNARYITQRLVHTETAHFLGEGQKMAYEEAGIEKYRFIASLSERTCERCGELDNQVYKLTDAQTGVNYPPIHPNCRCVTIMADFTPKTRNARNPETGENYKVDGSMSFNEWKESLTPEQSAAMEQHVKQMKNKSADRKQYEKYKELLGAENLPKTFDKFQALKYNEVERFELLKDYKNSRSTNMISAFTSFKDYEKYKKRINDELVGLTTVDGVEITGQTKHFIERVFGTNEDPKTHRPRNGVKIEEVKDTLLNGTPKHTAKSLKYYGSSCKVSVNNSGKLIQTNPYSSKKE